MLLHVLRFKIEINDFILVDRTKIALTLRHEALEVMIDTNLNFYSHLSNYVRKLQINLMY